MSVVKKQSAFVDPTAVSLSLSQAFVITGASDNPAYLVLTALDRNEYTVGASGATGSFTGNDNTLGFGAIGGDGRGAGIVFAYQPTSGRYYNSTYGFLDQLTYNSSSSLGDVTSLSLFGTSDLNLANQYAGNAYAMMQVDPAGYLGSATVVTRPKSTGAVPAQATPKSIAAAADSLVGQVWNTNGCWTLTSTIAADAGTSLPVQSTAVGLPGQANGEWIVAFNGADGQTGNWQSMVTAGEMVLFGTPDGGGHITTCVAGSGSTAMLVDNVTFVNGFGLVVNGAHDGSSNDIIIGAPHAASQEWAGVQASTVVIYELDTPIVTAKVASDSLAGNGTQSLSDLFAATDPGNKTITQWQVYDTATSDALVLDGVSYQGHTAASALTATSLSALSLLAGATPTTDTLEVRAYNGSYWGDWASLAVAITGTVPAAASPPVPATATATDTSGLATAESFAAESLTGSVQPAAPVVVKPAITVSATTSNQAWTDGQAANLVLPSNTFTDALGLKMTFAAYQVSGPNVTSWLHFNAATDTLYGTVPATINGIAQIEVIASDARGAQATDLFSVTLAPAAGLAVSAAQVGSLPSVADIDPSHAAGPWPLYS
ncbi:MAG TPA: putative Ig domain-containing protein [Rhodopila sp.]|nr:putative Ig domain-containing protein [Rhodopila sp.]